MKMPLKARMRFGPFPIDTTVCKIQVNGKEVDCELFESGDNKWAIVEFGPTRTKLPLCMLQVQICRKGLTWPEFQLEDTFKTNSDIFDSSLIIYVVADVLGVLLVVLGVVVYIVFIKKKDTV